ncbi:uncharacterized protein LOC111333967 [Stylophora pistillata]|nr:uncharacterized protein LOC111333967 [Stylophora pistillata]
MARLFLEKAKSDKDFLKKFVHECLPPECRDFPKVPPAAWGLPGVLLFGAGAISPFALVTMPVALYTSYRASESIYSSAGSSIRQATKEDVREVQRKAEPELVKNDETNRVRQREFTPRIFNVKEASDILHGYIDEEELSKERSQELLRSIEPYIYGGTPMYEAITRATECFEKNAFKFSSHKKLLFVLSDGKPADGKADDWTRIERAVRRLNNAGVTVVSCFVTTSTRIDPRRLYSEKRDDWELAAKFLFSLSSTLPTQSIPRSMFVKREWSIETTNNETCLFLHVNHPDHLREACQLAREVVCSQEALSDLLADVDLDVYINQSVSDYEAQEKQEGHTCYAHASATVLHLAMTRIHGREGGIPTFKELKDEMIGEFGKEATSINKVLMAMCKKYRLRYKQVDLCGAMEAVASSRPVVATFKLTHDEWGKFKEFFETNGKGVLTKKEIDMSARLPNIPRRFGHAVVLTSFNSEYLRLLNSWGHDWGDYGFFQVQNAEVLGFKFIDVYWEVDDLNKEEKNSFQELGSKRAKWLMETLPSLQRDDNTVTCPSCRKDSPVKDFTGNLLRAKCPKCKGRFHVKDAPKGNILVLNIYLTSLISSK